jgi:hypothetical protein
MMNSPRCVSNWPGRRPKRRAATRAATRAAERDREALDAMRHELDDARADMRAERDALRIAHNAQIAQIQRNADERAAALTQALDAYRAQSPTPTRSKRTRTPRDEN